MENKNNFAVFILTHGRPDKVKTYDSLKKCGYTGEIYLIVDDEDQQRERYIAKYGDKVMLFNKKEIAKTFDTADNFDDMRAIVYARNASFKIAEALGIQYFIQLDDDYVTFSYKFNTKLIYKERNIKNLDHVFASLLVYYKSINALSVALAQNGDFIGGKTNSFAIHMKPKRKAMNTFICSLDRKFNFLGRVNEDVNTYVSLGTRGYLFLTIPLVAINQMSTQKNTGGMTELYLDSGTYLKSFYTVMYAPSCVKISEMGDKHKRIHHSISWNNAVPKIVPESYRKV